MRTDAIRFKGTRHGVHLVIEPETEFPSAILELDQRLKGTDQFFRSANVMLNVGDRAMSDADAAALQETLNRYGLTVVAVEAAHTDTRSIYRGLGIPVEMPEGNAFQGGSIGSDEGRVFPDGTGYPGARNGTQEGRRDGIVVVRTLRSGQSVEHEGDICLVGDVNPGAEILAGGSVIVWGSLRGVAQAGLQSPEGAVVCALELAPTQLRIGSIVTRQPDAPETVSEIAPELARVVDGQIIVERWVPRAQRARSLRP